MRPLPDQQPDDFGRSHELRVPKRILPGRRRSRRHAVHQYVGSGQLGRDSALLGKEILISQSTEGCSTKASASVGCWRRLGGSERLILAGVGLTYPGPVCACKHCSAERTDVGMPGALPGHGMASLYRGDLRAGTWEVSAKARNWKCCEK